jgi:hypothetical protein
MPYPGTLRRVALVRTEASEERIAYIMRVTRIGEVGTTLAVTSNWSTLRASLQVCPINNSFHVILLLSCLQNVQRNVMWHALGRYPVRIAAAVVFSETSWCLPVRAVRTDTCRRGMNLQYGVWCDGRVTVMCEDGEELHFIRMRGH